MEQNKLITIIGPTAIGKTSLSIDLATHYKTEVLSCDSRQFYKEMQIGTAVPSNEELSAVKHHFIQNRSIFEEYSVGAFERDAVELLNRLFKERSIMMMTGGSGLYVDAVIKGLDDFPEVNPEIRKDLKVILHNEGITRLQMKLKEIDPVSFGKIDIHNKQRLIRALEISIGTDKPYSHYLGLQTKKRSFDAVKIGLQADREVIYDRINRRVDLMMQQGLLEESRSLYEHRDLNALQTVGYKELFAYFDNLYSLEEAVNEIKKNTRRFAKRQGTWFRRDPEITWFDYKTDLDEILSFIDSQR
ncbi:tRNA (adenosine(37)-N6)-dimethylallyltransferase MiaA [Lutimonas vermicola]|uniref:tRNA dimethylallyltransferase n=1 Tax=Lutimonas vermicola TaxID=414288 RepID=A0ABU9KY82_9FLAO